MEIDVRLKALTRLAQSTTDAAKAALRVELGEASTTLETRTEYTALRHSLEILGAIGYRFSDLTVAVIEKFIQRAERLEVTYPNPDGVFADSIAKHSDAHSLIVRAVEVVVYLRYYEPGSLLRILLELYEHPAASVREKVRSGLDCLARYDFQAFYGQDTKDRTGPVLQDAVLGLMESMDEPALKSNREAALRLLTGMLSPVLEGTSWSSNAVTISQTTIPAHPGVLAIRQRDIRLLFRLYSLAETTQQKLAVIAALGEGARLDHRGLADENVREMIAGNTLEILAFFARLVPDETFQIVQKIESNSYWIFVHALSEEIKTGAKNVEEAIARNGEYATYRILIGFEGVFGDWSNYDKNIEQYEAIEKERREKATIFASSITTDTYGDWRARILEYAKTESDDLATFPVFYHFLSEFASLRPDLALRLVSEDRDGVARFLIPILSSLWNGSLQAETRGLVEQWIGDVRVGDRHYLFAATKMFLSTRELDFELLKRLLKKAAEVGDVSCVRQVVTVALARWDEARDTVLKELLFPALNILTRLKDAGWIFEAWFRKEARDLFATMDNDEIEHVLRNLILLPEIDYHAEEVLFSFAQRNPERVVRFLIERIAIELGQRSDDGQRSYSAIPFELYKLQEPLSKIPDVAVRNVLEQFRADSTLFIFFGARLLKNIFPTFSGGLEAALLQLVRGGGDSNLEFVTGVLRNYHGEPFVHRLCKEIVKTVESASPWLTEVEIALQSTGVVSGELGFAEAYESKRGEILDWLSDPNEKVKAFATRYVADLKRMRDAETKRAEERIALRKHRFDEE